MKNYDILLFTDFEEGHVFPLFQVAKNLESHGFNVCFVGIADTMKVVQKHGFNYYIILEDMFPENFVQDVKHKKVGWSTAQMINYLEKFAVALKEIVQNLDPKIVFSSYFFLLEALVIHYYCKSKQIIFHTALPTLERDSEVNSLGQYTYFACFKSLLGYEKQIVDYFKQLLEENSSGFHNLEEMVAPLKSLPQVVLCPKEFDLPGSFNLNDLDFYLGPSINRAKDKGNHLFFNNLKEKVNSKIIYASMGSQTKEYPERALKFFNMILGSMRSEALSSYHLVLSLGAGEVGKDLDNIPENVTVFDWVPQKEILQGTALAIIHGGLGSIKECIYFGVPMLIIPMGRDQMDNSKRVSFHRLGATLEIETIATEALTENILSVLNDKKTRGNLSKMKLLFRKAEKDKKEISIVNELLNNVYP